VAGIEVKWSMRKVWEFLDKGYDEIDVRVVVGMVEEGTKWMQWPADGWMVQGFRQPDSIAGYHKIDFHHLSIFQEARAPLSELPAALAFLQRLPPARQCWPPPYDVVLAMRLQALKMACSWLYGFFSVMMRPYVLARSVQGVNQRLMQRRLCPLKSHITIIGDRIFGCATFPARVRGLLVAKCMDFAAAAR
jgi:hypothetical protein